ncbi:MAG: sigma-54 dependent transcriptional regulator [Deltaproteobacteria bacterium]|nr:sigma-54 dependent transcriptional regulator [Deltaproteobacteria bacterium]
MSGNILIVDDDQSMAETISRAMTQRGFVVTWKTSAAEALTALDEQDFDVVVTDLHMEGMDGFAFCERVAANRPDVPVVMITAFGSMDTAVTAIRAGVYDFITKPFDLEVLRLTLARAVQHRALRDEVKRLRQEVSEVRGSDLMIGSSPAIKNIKELIDRVSGSDATLYITGGSGTGKELVAQAVHRRSRNAAGPFVAINCAAMPESLLESELFGHVKGAFTDARTPRQGLFLKANGGTLFLDEIGEMPIGMQPKLLRALQERTVRPVGGDKEIPYEARIITASNRDLELEVEERRFREDLFYRINVLRVDVPALRARGNDVLILAQHFVKLFSGKTKKHVVGISPAVAEKLMNYSWPGNVRELQNCIERAIAFARFDDLMVDDLPEKIRDYKSSDFSIAGVGAQDVMTLEEVERRYILRVLKQLDGNKTAAADQLGLDRRTLYRKLERWDAAGTPEAVE